MANFLPYTGTKGRFRFKEPFNHIYPDGSIYTVAALKTFSNLMDTGINVYRKIYIANGLTSDDYNRDFNDGSVAIAELLNDEAGYILIPTSYILSVPDINGVPYVNKILAVDLGDIREDSELDSLTKLIEEVCTITIGIKPVIKKIDASPLLIVNNEQDELMRKKQIININSGDNVFINLKNCKDKFEQIKKDNEALAEVIKTLQSEKNNNTET